MLLIELSLHEQSFQCKTNFSRIYFLLNILCFIQVYPFDNSHFVSV